MASIGLLLPTRELVMGGRFTEAGALVELARRAEALGLDAVWVGDSILARPRLEPLTTLSAVAAATERLRLGTAVLLSALRQPVVLANEVASLDLLSRGRLVLGLGTGARLPANVAEFEACGVPFRRRIGVFEEGLEVMQRLWSQPEVSFEGRHFRLEGVRPGLRPFAPSGIRVWLSASEDVSLRRVAQHADGWLTLAPSAEVFARRRARLEELASEQGRGLSELPGGAYVTLNIDDDEERAGRQMRTFIEGYYNGRFEDLTRVHAVCAGPAAKCAAWLKEFLAVGVDALIVRFSSADQLGHLERFAAEVLPALR